MDRKARLLSTSDRSSRIVEIGPSYNPVAPKADGWRTHVVDCADRPTLRAKYSAAAVDLDAIEDVDTIWQAGALDEAVPSDLRGRFDTLIASHVIEHTPDLAGFLLAAQRLVTQGGSVALAIPDRRFCFDCFRPPSSTGDVLQAHAARRIRHTRRTAWDHTAYAATMAGALGWSDQSNGELAFMESFASAAAAHARFDDAAAAPYTDFHAWQFTPAGFALVILELGQLGITDWRIESLYGPEGFEFFAFLRRGAETFPDSAALQARRMALLLQQSEEQFRAGGTTAVAGSLFDRSVATCAAVTGEGEDGSGIESIASRYYAEDGTRKPRLYLAEYEKLFRGIRDAPIRVLELGIFSGASLLVWRDYLPNAVIVGVDINDKPKCLEGESRIRTIRGSQDDPAVLDEAARLAGGPFDVIIDDASHIGYLTKRSLYYLFPRWLKPGGHYVIEDIGTAFLPDYPDGTAYADPPWDDASSQSRDFESVQSGMVGVVKQLVDYTLTELSTGKRAALDIERVVIVTNLALITKANKPPDTAPRPMPGGGPKRREAADPRFQFGTTAAKLKVESAIGRYPDHAANERTFLDWIRTAITIVAFGFVVEKLDSLLEVATHSIAGGPPPASNQLAGDVGGLLLLMLGGALMVIATVRFRRTTQDIDQAEVRPARGRRMGIALTLLLLGLGGTLLAYLLYTVFRRMW